MSYRWDTDIVERLRSHLHDPEPGIIEYTGMNTWIEEAADEIERLRAQEGSTEAGRGERLLSHEPETVEPAGPSDAEHKTAWEVLEELSGTIDSCNCSCAPIRWTEECETCGGIRTLADVGHPDCCATPDAENPLGISARTSRDTAPYIASKDHRVAPDAEREELAAFLGDDAAWLRNWSGHPGLAVAEVIAGHIDRAAAILRGEE